MAIPPVDNSSNPIPATVALEILESGLALDSPLAFELALANPAMAPLPTLGALVPFNDPTSEAALMQDMAAVAAADATLLQALEPAVIPVPLAQLNDAANLAGVQQDVLAAADASLLQAMDPAAMPDSLAPFNDATNMAVVQQDMLAAADATLLQAMAPAAASATLLPAVAPVPAPLLPVLDPASVLDNTLLPAGVPVIPADPAADPQALAIAAPDVTIADTQQAVQAALQAGASDVSLVLSGLPQGAIALMLGAGWTPVVPDGLNGAESAASWAFHFPLRVLDVPAVASTSFAAHTGVRGKPADLPAPLTAYGSRGQPEPAPGASFASTMDLLD